MRLDELLEIAVASVDKDASVLDLALMDMAGFILDFLCKLNAEVSQEGF